MTRRTGRNARTAVHTTAQHYRAKSADPDNCRTCAGRRVVANADRWIAVAKSKLPSRPVEPSRPAEPSPGLRLVRDEDQPSA